MGRNKLSSKKRGILALILLICLAISVSVVFYLSKEDADEKTAKTADYSQLCVSDSIGQKLSGIYSTEENIDIKLVKDTIGEIERLDDIQDAPNCLFALGELNGILGYYEVSAEHYSDLISLYEQTGSWISSAVSSQTSEDINRLIGHYQDSRSLFLNAARVE